jgi:hypothetical protein
MMPPRGPRRLLWVVGHHVGVRHGVGVDAGGDQAGVMGHVDHEDGTDILGHLAKRSKSIRRL